MRLKIEHDWEIFSILVLFYFQPTLTKQYSHSRALHFISKQRLDVVAFPYKFYKYAVRKLMVNNRNSGRGCRGTGTITIGGGIPNRYKFRFKRNCCCIFLKIVFVHARALPLTLSWGEVFKFQTFDKSKLDCENNYDNYSCFHKAVKGNASTWLHLLHTLCKRMVGLIISLIRVGLVVARISSLNLLQLWNWITFLVQLEIPLTP